MSIKGQHPVYKIYIEELENPSGMTQKDFLAKHPVSNKSLVEWKKDWEAKKKGEEYDSDKWLESKDEVVDSALIEACEKKNAKALELFFRRRRKLVDQQEITNKFELSADERVKVAREFLNRLREEYSRNSGYCPVCRRPETLCSETCLDTEPEQSENREVAGVAVSARPD